MGRPSWVNRTCGKPHVSIQTYMRNLCGSGDSAGTMRFPHLIWQCVECSAPSSQYLAARMRKTWILGMSAGFGGVVKLFPYIFINFETANPLEETMDLLAIFTLFSTTDPQSTTVPHPKRRMPGPSHKAKRLAWRYGRGDASAERHILSDWTIFVTSWNDVLNIPQGMMCIDRWCCLWHTVGRRCCTPYVVSAKHLFIRICEWYIDRS